MYPNEEQLERAVILLNGKLLGIVLGFLFGSGLFLATNFLLLKGGPHVERTLAYSPTSSPAIA